MTKTYHLHLRHGGRYYRPDSGAGLICADQIRHMTEWEKLPEAISITVSDKKLPGFREIAIDGNYAYGNGIDTTESYLTYWTRAKLRAAGFGQRFWIRIRAAA